MPPAPRVSATRPRFDSRTIRGYYRLGRYIESRYAAKLKKMAKTHENPKSVPGLGQQLCEEQKISRSILDGSRLFARQFTPDQVKELIKLKRTNRFRLTRRHIIALLSVKDATAALKLAQDCVDEGWSANRLEGIVRQRYPKSKWGGRPPAPAKTRGEILQQLVEASERWLRWWRSQCRMDGKKPASTAMLSRELLHDCQYHAERLTELAERAGRFLAKERENGNAKRKDKRKQ